MNSKAISAYRIGQVSGTSAEQQAALLMEAGQLFVRKAIKAIESKDFNEMSRCFQRVIEIIDEAIFRLNIDEEGGLALNLLKIYDWWTKEILEVAVTRDIARLETLYGFMGDIRQAWETKAKK